VSVEVRHSDISGFVLSGLGGDGFRVVVTLVSFNLETDSTALITRLLRCHVEVAFDGLDLLRIVEG